MADLKQFEYFLLRYVPDAVRDEPVNIGFVLHEAGGAGSNVVRITDDWKRARCADPGVDLEVLNGLGTQLQQELNEQGWERVIGRMQDMFSNSIQVSGAKGILAADSAEAVARLREDYLISRVQGGEGKISGRRAILGTMKDELTASGILRLMRQDISLSAYTGKKGDPQRFDFAYPMKGGVGFLQALSLRTSVQPGLVLAARFPSIVADVLRAQGAQARLTAVVENDLDRQKEELGFVLGMMAESEIRVEEVREMPRVAAEIRGELGL